MAKSFYHYLRAAYKRPKQTIKQQLKQKIVEWRKSETVVRVNHPTRLDRAHALGYKAKQGFVVVRVKQRKGGRRRPYRRGKKPSKAGLVHFTHGKSLRWIAEEKAWRKYRNMEVLNSYLAGEDGQFEYYEVILVDPNSPAVRSDKDVKWITTAANRHRVLKGLTSAGKKSRGLK
ncbi:MAG TPA: 50S ribosomal protein L15e [archaeon]|nr:50S ribosomal protein L15e [archaeon]